MKSFLDFGRNPGKKSRNVNRRLLIAGTSANQHHAALQRLVSVKLQEKRCGSLKCKLLKIQNQQWNADKNQNLIKDWTFLCFHAQVWSSGVNMHLTAKTNSSEIHNVQKTPHLSSHAPLTNRTGFTTFSHFYLLTETACREAPASWSEPHHRPDRIKVEYEVNKTINK